MRTFVAGDKARAPLSARAQYLHDVDVDVGVDVDAGALRLQLRFDHLERRMPPREPASWLGVERSLGRPVCISARARDATREAIVAALPPLLTMPALLDVITTDELIYYVEEAPIGVPALQERRAPAVMLGPWLALLDELVRLESAGLSHGALLDALVLTPDGRLILAALHAPRAQAPASSQPHAARDALAAGTAMVRTLAPETLEAIDLDALGYALAEGRTTLSQAAANLREVMELHVRNARDDIDKALSRPPWQALRALHDSGTLWHDDTARRVSERLAPSLLRTLDDNVPRTRLDELAMLPIDDALLAHADDATVGRGARVAALRVLERRARRVRAEILDGLIRLLHDDDVVVAAAARRALAHHDDVALRRASGAFARCAHGWRNAMDADVDEGMRERVALRYCASCDARVSSAADGEHLLDEETDPATPVLILEGPEGRHRFAMIGDEVVIGRDGSTDIAIGHTSIQPRHVIVRFVAGRFFVEAVDNAPLEIVRGDNKRGLEPGDLVRFMSFTLAFGSTEGTRQRDTTVQRGSDITQVLIARRRALAVCGDGAGTMPRANRTRATGVNAIVEDVTMPPSWSRVVVVWSAERSVHLQERDFTVLSRPGESAHVESAVLQLTDDGIEIH